VAGERRLREKNTPQEERGNRVKDFYEFTRAGEVSRKIGPFCRGEKDQSTLWRVDGAEKNLRETRRRVTGRKRRALTKNLKPT